MPVGVFVRGKEKDSQKTVNWRFSVFLVDPDKQNCVQVVQSECGDNGRLQATAVSGMFSLLLVTEIEMSAQVRRTSGCWGAVFVISKPQANTRGKVLHM